jgi:molybdate transport system substrate-binding protein
MTLYAGGIVSRTTHPEQARQLLDFLASQEAAKAIKASGLDPIAK